VTATPGQAERFALGELVRTAAGEIKRCRSVTVVCQPCEEQIAAVLLAADAYAKAAAQEPHAAPLDIDQHRRYAVVRSGGRFLLAAVDAPLDGLRIYTDEAEFNDAEARDFE
jgi:hypothetical protein